MSLELKLADGAGRSGVPVAGSSGDGVGTEFPGAVSSGGLGSGKLPGTGKLAPGGSGVGTSVWQSTTTTVVTTGPLLG